MKTCTKCLSAKELTEFYKRKQTPDGVEAWCKVCRLAHNKDWFENNKVRHSELTAKWYSENKDQHLENSRNWYANNRYRKIATCSAREKRIVNATPKWLSQEQKLAIQTIYKIASELSNNLQKFEVDHIVPIKGKTVSGLHVPWNLQVITQSQNRRKAAKLT
jgi:hypothetical protein